MAYQETKSIAGLSGMFNDLGETQQNLVKCLKIHIDPTILNKTGEIEVHEPLPRALVLNAIIDVTTKEATGATKTMTFGTKNTTDGGDIDGFIAAASVAAVAAVLGAGALIGTICPADDHLVVGVPQAMTELVADLYLFYIEV